jgi:hypothetical protein
MAQLPDNTTLKAMLLEEILDLPENVRDLTKKQLKDLASGTVSMQSLHLSTSDLSTIKDVYFGIKSQLTEAGVAVSADIVCCCCCAVGSNPNGYDS